MVKSPCTNVCEIDDQSHLCIGCYRNEYEVFNWIHFSEEQKKLVILELKNRNIYRNDKFRLSYWLG